MDTAAAEPGGLGVAAERAERCGCCCWCCGWGFLLLRPSNPVWMSSTRGTWYRFPSTPSFFRQGTARPTDVASLSRDIHLPIHFPVTSTSFHAQFPEESTHFQSLHSPKDTFWVWYPLYCGRLYVSRTQMTPHLLPGKSFHSTTPPPNKFPAESPHQLTPSINQCPVLAHNNYNDSTSSSRVSAAAITTAPQPWAVAPAIAPALTQGKVINRGRLDTSRCGPHHEQTGGCLPCPR